MTDPIYFQFTPNKDDYTKVIRAYYMSDRRLWLVLALAGIMELWLLVSTLAGNFGASPLVWGLLLALPVVVVYLLVWGPVRLGRRVQKNERLTCETFWQVGDDQILIKDRFAEAKLDWGTFQRVIETKSYYLLIYAVNSRAFQFVPKRAFESQERQAAFRELVKRNIKG